nr:vegetative cell wall protein gp1 [Colletotrichum truncatum]KAF6782605.1 vegetative cell wall protein gp1 [Colletotrichum truncatum]
MMMSLSGELGSIRTILMRLERPLGEEHTHFVLEDATGRAFPVYLKTITSWDAFEYLITDRFKGKKGAHRVQRKRYALQNRGTQKEVDRSIHWDNAFLPHQRVDMSLICREAQALAQTTLAPSCPFCGSISPGEADIEVQCSKCNMFFTRVVEVDDEELPTLPSPPQGRNVRFGESAFTATTKRPRDDEDWENSDGCSCSKPKRHKRQQDLKRKSRRDESESDSDEEDVRGFMRVKLISKRIRVQESHAPFHALTTESIDSMVQKVLGQQTGVSAATLEVEGNGTIPFSYGTGSSFEDVPQGNGPISVFRATGIDSDSDRTSNNPNSVVFRDVTANSTIQSASTPHEESKYDSSKDTPQRPATNTHFGTLSSDLSKDKLYSGMASPRYTSDGYYATASLSAAPSHPNDNRKSSYIYFQASESDEEEIIEVDGEKYVIPVKSKRQTTTSPLSPQQEKKPAPVRLATETDAKKFNIPPGYSLKNWDPTEVPILLFGSVFDTNSLGKWIYDWTVYYHGPATPIPEMAGELWLLLIQLAGNTKRADAAVELVRNSESKEIVLDFVDAGERLIDKLRKLLKACEAPMLKTKKKGAPLGKEAGIEFVKTLFDRDRELERTERFMTALRLFNLRFDSNCGEIIRNPTR